MIVKPHREADRRIRGATASAAWGVSGIAIVSPLSEHVTMLDRLFGFRYSKSLHLPGVAPLSVSCDRVRNALWVGGANGILVRLSNAEYQPTELGRVDVGGRIGWVALGASALDTRNRRDTSAHFLETPAGDQRVSNMRSDFMAFVPSPTGIRVFNARLDGMQEMGEIQGVPSYEAGAFDALTGCLFLASSRGQGAVVRVNADNSFTTLSRLSFPNVQGAIQARVIGDALHIICESRNRWLTWDISDPVNPILAADDTYDVGLYWEQNPVRWITATGELLRRTGSWPGFISQDWPIVDGGYAIEPLSGEEYRWALHGEIGQITWDQRRGITPFRVFQSGGLASPDSIPGRKVGCMMRPEGVITDAHSPPITVDVDYANNQGGVNEVVVFDANDVEVFSRTISLSSTRIPRLTIPITVGYYDCLEGRVAHNGSRNEQYVSDGTTLVYTKLPFTRRAALRARVSGDWSGASDGTAIITTSVRWNPAFTADAVNVTVAGVLLLPSQLVSVQNNGAGYLQITLAVAPVLADALVVASALGTPRFTTSTSGFFRNPADPIVTITRFYESEDGYIVVQLAVAPAAGRIVTIQDSTYPSGTAEVGGSRVRLVPPVVFFTVRETGAAANCPAPESTYSTEGGGHTFGTYKFRWKSGAFFDPATNQYFVFNLDGTARLVARHLVAQPFGAPNATWTDLSAALDAAPTEAGAQALAAAVSGIIVLPPTDQVRMQAALLNPPAGCTGSIELFFECLSPGLSP